MNRGLYFLLFFVIISLSIVDCKKDNSNNNSAPNKPSNPIPLNGATNLGTNAILKWDCSDPENDALTYDIYFGTESNPPLIQSNVSTKIYSTGLLDYNKTYYWKIVAKDVNNNSTTGNVWSFNNQSDPARDKVVDDYNNIFLTTNTTNVGWTGNAAICDPGTISDEIQTKTLQRLNYIRTIVGLPGDVTFDVTKNPKCQQGAFMCHVNNELNHTPPDTWKCYTNDGYTGTSNSNLASGGVGPNAILSYMMDNGSSNFFCGHRRWILYSREKVMGHGCTSSYDCLWTLGNNGNPAPANMPEFISWPPKDHVVYALVYPRWSFSVPAADFTNTTVTMSDIYNTNISLAILSFKDNGYGDNTIVWEPKGIITSNKTDVTYNVKVNNVIINKLSKNYEYKVIIIHP